MKNDWTIFDVKKSKSIFSFLFFGRFFSHLLRNESNDNNNKKNEEKLAITLATLRPISVETNDCMHRRWQNEKKCFLFFIYSIPEMSTWNAIIILRREFCEFFAFDYISLRNVRLTIAWQSTDKRLTVRFLTLIKTQAMVNEWHVCRHLWMKKKRNGKRKWRIHRVLDNKKWIKKDSRRK